MPCHRPPAAIGPLLDLPVCPPRSSAGALSSPPPRPPPVVSAHYIYRIIPTPTNQLFVLAHVSPLYRLSLLIRVGVGVGFGIGVGVGVRVHIGVRPIAADTPPRGNILPTVEVVKCKPRSPLYEEAAVKVEGAGLLLVLVRMYPLRTGEIKNTSSHNQYIRT